MKIPTFLRRLSALLAIVLLLTSPAFAQGKWWQADHRFFRELKLTADQSRRLEEIFQASLPALKAHKKQLDEAETKFAALMERGGDQQIMVQLNYVETARAELNKSRVMMQLRMKNALTSDQWAKFTALHQAADRERAQSEHPAPGPGGGGASGGPVK
jgi:Spy/CpxP family protein refolding chaperone